MKTLYTKTKIFHFKDKIDSLPESVDRVEAPIHIRIKPTNVCNHNCRYCAYKADNIQLGKDMIRRDYIPKEKIMEIIDDVIDMGIKAITFSGGGEPFCYPYLLETVKKLSRSHVKFASLTNGVKLQGEIAGVFAHYGTWIRISMDGWDDESYSLYRGVPSGEFTKTIRNMKNFKKLGGKCCLGVNLIVDRGNASHICEFSNKLKDVGIDSLKISPCIVSNDGVETSEYHKPIFKQVKNEIKKAQESIKKEIFEIIDAYYELEGEFYKEYTWCPYIQILPVIGADQNVYSCQDKAYNLEEGLIGSIKSMRFKNFWFSNKNKFFKINPSVNCNHHCVADIKNKFVLEYLNVNKEHLGFV